MVLGSHNSWSYLKAAKWWKRPFAFMAKCQRVDIRTQYEKGVRCFDLRLRVNGDGNMYIAHGLCEYQYTIQNLSSDLEWLNQKGDCYVRVLHEARYKWQYTEASRGCFGYICSIMVKEFPRIKFFGGQNLYDWSIDFNFNEGKEEVNDPTVDEKHASVSKPKLLDDWWPWLYAWVHNEAIKILGTEKDILMIDYIDLP